MVPYELKKKCVELAKDKYGSRYIYDTVFHKAHPEMSYATFKAKLSGWKKKEYPSLDTLLKGTYEGFTAHGATVQVDGEGNITQAWIKQSAEETDYSEMLDAIKGNIQPVKVEPCKIEGEEMLEIPLFDMHFGIATLDTYRNVLSELLTIIGSKYYDEINIVIGQDLLHTNDMRGHTAKGTEIGKIDFQKAFTDAYTFYCNIIEKALEHSPRVNVIYSKGNHDECTSWCFAFALQTRYPQVNFDLSFLQRKVIHWKRCFIGLTHGNETKKSYNDFRGQFTVTFPMEFANSDVREVHTGHLHCESERGDAYGVLVRRLSSAVPTDQWSDNEGFVGAQKRFMIFEWKPGRLSALYYI